MGFFGRVVTATAALILASQTTSAALQKFQACGEEIKVGEGYIQTPGYPQNYPRNLDCTWTLVAPRGAGWELDIIDLNNRDVFNSGVTSCEDKLDIYERDASSSLLPVAKNLCASSVADLSTTKFSVAAKTTGEAVVRIQFKADYSDQHPGFSIKFKASCDKALSGDSGTFSSVGHPENYLPGIKCVTNISSPPGSVLEINFSSFRLEDSLQCKKDYVDVEIGSSSLASDPKRYCGSKGPKIFKTKSTSVSITFVSDLDIQYPGYSGSWRAVYYPFPMFNQPDYSGRCATTMNGKTCQRWDTNTPHRTKFRPDDASHNFCRSPDNDIRSPWCYTTDPDLRWEYCDISTCVEEQATTQVPTTVTTVADTTFPPTTEDNSTTSILTTAGTTTEAQPNITAVFNETPLVDKQTGEATTGAFPWFIILIVVILLILLLVLVVVFLRRRRKRKTRSIHGDEPPVIFTQTPDDETRPRENTYVEIPFLSANRTDSDAARGDLSDNGPIKPSANGYVNSSADQSASVERGSTSSVDSIVEAKLKAYKEDKERQEAQSNPYDMAEETPKKNDPLYTAATDPTPHTDNENPYSLIDTHASATVAPPSTTFDKPTQHSEKQKVKKKKKTKFSKFFKSKSAKESKSSAKPEAGFSNPFFEEENKPKIIKEEGNMSSDNPFSSDDEKEKESKKQPEYTKIPPKTKKIKEDKPAANVTRTPPLPVKQTSVRKDEVSDPYDFPVNPSNPTYQVPSAISPMSNEKVNKFDFDDTLPYDMKPTDKTYDTPSSLKGTFPPKPLVKGEMVAMSPEIIDNEDGMQSPVFEMSFSDENLYNAPSSLKNNNTNNSFDKPRTPSSSESDQTDKRSSTKSHLSYDNEEDQKGGYCVMTSAPRRGKPSLNETPDKQNNRESGMYTSMSPALPTANA